jgi:hypothetical protein
MADWQYLPECRIIVIPGDDCDRPADLPGPASRREIKGVVAQGVSSEYGPLLAMAPRMEACLRKVHGPPLRVVECVEMLNEMRAILNELDEARAGAGK